MKKLFTLFCVTLMVTGCAGGKDKRLITTDTFLAAMKEAGLKFDDIIEFKDDIELKRISRVYGGRVILVDAGDVTIMIMQCDTIDRAKRIYNIEQRGSTVVSGTDKFARNQNLLFSAAQRYLDNPDYETILNVFNSL